MYRSPLLVALVPAALVIASNSSFARNQDSSLVAVPTAAEVGCPQDQVEHGVRIGPSLPGDSLRVTYTDGLFGPEPNWPVAIEVYAQQLTGGHCHASGSRPIGVPQTANGNTGPDGHDFKVMHHWPDIAGRLNVLFYGTDCNCAITHAPTDTAYHADILVQGLVELAPDNAYNLVGGTSIHPYNHYGTPALLDSLQAAASEWVLRASPTQAKKLNFNDMSLPWGGIFDLRGDWTTPHKSHRRGIDADVRTWKVDANGDTVPMYGGGELRLLRELLERRFTILEHQKGESGVFPHWHLRLRSTTGLASFESYDSQAVQGLQVTVHDSVSFDPVSGNYTYWYALTNESSSTQPISRFAISPATGVFSISEPAHWTAFSGWQENQNSVVWAVSDAGAPPVGWDGTNVYASTFELQPGQTIAGFNFVTTYPPATATFYAQAFDTIPCCEETLDESYQSPTLFQQAFSGSAHGPNVSMVGVAGIADVAARPKLGLPRPNPAPAGAQIPFSLPSAADVSIGVYDLAGRLVRIVAAGRFSSGSHTVHWNGRDASGNVVSGGVYFYSLDVNGHRIDNRKAILLH